MRRYSKPHCSRAFCSVKCWSSWQFCFWCHLGLCHPRDGTARFIEPSENRGDAPLRYKRNSSSEIIRYETILMIALTDFRRFFLWSLPRRRCRYGRRFVPGAPALQLSHTPSPRRVDTMHRSAPTLQTIESFRLSLQKIVLYETMCRPNGT